MQALAAATLYGAGCSDRVRCEAEQATAQDVSPLLPVGARDPAPDLGLRKRGRFRLFQTLVWRCRQSGSRSCSCLSGLCNRPHKPDFCVVSGEIWSVVPVKRPCCDINVSVIWSTSCRINAFPCDVTSWIRGGGLRNFLLVPSSAGSSNAIDYKSSMHSLSSTAVRRTVIM